MPGAGPGDRAARIPRMKTQVPAPSASSQPVATALSPLLAAGPEALGAAAAGALASAAAARDRFVALPAGTPFLEAVDAFDALGHHLNTITGAAGLFFQVHPAPGVRERAAAVEQDISRYATDLSLDRAVYERLAALDLSAPEAQAQPVARRLVEKALRDFRRAGVDRDEASRTRVRALREELVLIGQEFSRTIASDVRTVTIPEGRAGLEGLPEDWIASHPPAADGSVAVTTNPTDFLPFMKYAQNGAYRQALYRAYHSRGAPANLDVLARMLARRHELATLLGYPSWAAYATEDKMIRTPGRAAEFVARVTELTGARLQREVDELLEAQRRTEPGAQVIHDYDRMQLMESVRRDRLRYDSRDARPYFPYEAVKRGVLDTTARLHGLHFQKLALACWHPDIEAWDVRENGVLLARFYLDMHPRTDKYKHAAMFDLVAGFQPGAAAPAGRVPEACLVCNFPQPTDDDPGLMEPGEVTTLFHEFGHLMHHLLAGRQRWLSVAGISTEWDFVEVPSQLYEEWSRDVSVLQSFARHHVTGEPIPAALVARMRAAADYGKGIGTRIQMFYAALSLAYYGGDPAGLDSTEVIRRLKPQYVPFPHEEGTTLQTGFGHLEGYTALYYTYMWSLVLAKDLFSQFGADLQDTAVARRYRQRVLEPGGSRDAELLVSDFLGRPFDFRAFEAWLAA